MTIFKALRRAVALFVSILVILVVGAPVAFAEEAHPGWEVTGRFGPSELHPGGYGQLVLYVFNGGAGSVSGAGPVVVDQLPKGLEAVSETPAGPEAEVTHESGGCSGTSVVTCQLGGIEPLGESAIVEIPVRVSSEAVPAVGEGEPVDLVSVSGGGALGVARAQVPVLVSAGSSFAPLGFETADAWLSNADGTTDTQAGSHPYSLTVTFAMNSKGLGVEAPSGGEMHALNVNLPPGLVGEPGATPKCTRQQFDDAEQNGAAGQCPLSSQIGWDYAAVSGLSLLSFPIFNLVPPPGVAAQFAFSYNGTSTFLDSGVRSGGDNGITTHINPLTQRDVVFNEATFWGFPGKVQAEQRGESKTAEELAQEGQRPLLTLPTSCRGPQEFSMEELGIWQEENAIEHENDPLFKAQTSFQTHNNAGEPVGFTGCEKLVHFQPSLEAAPDTSDTDTPAGLTATVRVPQNVNPDGLATAGLHATTVVLPEGMVINPGQATGLQACQSYQDGLGLAENGEVNEGPPSCPAASKVGTDEIVTPLLPDKLQGNVYILQSNPPELKLLVAASGDGVNIKQVGTVHLNEVTGQLTTTFASIPDAPFSEFKLSFSGGAQAALVTPPKCGVYSTTTSFTPWSTPLVAEAFDTTSFQITAGTGGSACPGSLPFNPVLSAGATTDQAGGFTNFSLLLTRGDDQQRIDGLQFKAPAGLTGFISKVPLCTNAQAESNTCPEASKIGHSVVESGPGPYPLVIPEAGQEPAPIYLTESYDGAPFGLSIVVPIHAGPFTLPTQRVRARIEVDPTTSALTVTTNPLPQVVEGIPTDLREVDAVIEKEGFMVDPTSCERSSFSGTAYGTPAPGVSEANKSAPISSHFKVEGCGALKFEPKLTAATSGKTSKTDGASLTYKIAYPNVPQGTDADIHYVKVELPAELPSRLTTLQKACTAKVFQANPAECPKESVIGRAVVHTPLLPVPLQGPVYFVSNGGEAFPNLEMVLQGDGVKIELVGDTLIKKGVTSTTFKTVPDDPFSSFEITLGQGPYSALTANGNLCKPTVTKTVKKKVRVQVNGRMRTVTRKVKEQVSTSLTIPSDYVAQNGATDDVKVPVTVTGCAKAHKAAKRAKKKKKKGNGKKK